MKCFKPLLKITVCLSLIFCMKSAFVESNGVAKAEIGGYLGSQAAADDCIPCQMLGGFTGGEAGGSVGSVAGQWIGGAIGSLGGLCWCCIRCLGRRNSGWNSRSSMIN